MENKLGVGWCPLRKNPDRIFWFWRKKTRYLAIREDYIGILSGEESRVCLALVLVGIGQFGRTGNCAGCGECVSIRI